MKLPRSTVEHPFPTFKYRIFSHPRLLRYCAQIEISPAMAYNLKRMLNILGGQKLIQQLTPA